MKVLINVVGILLIIFGVASLGYQGFTYTKQEKVVEIGNVKLTADAQKTVNIPPLVGGLAFVAGIVLVIAGRIGKSK